MVRRSFLVRIFKGSNPFIPKFKALKYIKEEWLSGLKRRSAKSLYKIKLYRGFKSLFFYYSSKKS